MEYRAYLDGLRAIAVLAVVVFHAAPTWLPGGFAGVDVFFVISGFLISSLVIQEMDAGRFNAWAFYGRRIRRLVPSLLLMLSAVWVFGWFTLRSGEYSQLGTHIAAGAGFASNGLLWTEVGYFDVAADAKPLLHLWSLGVEEQFYLGWPALVVVCYGRVSLVWITLASIVFSLAHSLAATAAQPALAFYWPTSRLWEFAVGATLACVSAAPARVGPAFPRSLEWVRRGASPRVRSVGSAIGLAFLAGSFIGLDSTQPFPGWRALGPVLGAALMIGAGPHTWISRQLLSRPVLVFVGLISYPLYLWHWPLITFTRSFAGGDAGGLALVTAVGLACVLAWLCFRFVEQPLRQVSSTRLAVAVPIVLVAGLAGVGGAGLYVRQNADTRPEHFPPVMQALADYVYRYEHDYRERRCYLMPEQTPDELAEECVDASPAGAPLVFLWGDSHAAHLAPGLRQVQRTRAFRLAEVAGARCPPLLGVETPTQPHCQAANRVALERIRTSAPDVVLMTARWALYDRLDRARLTETVSAVRQASRATRVVLIGPVPNWVDRLPRVLFNYARLHPLDPLPVRMSVGLVSYLPALDRELRERANALGVTYVSAMDVFCRSDGCTTTADGTVGGLTAWDESHLTVAGSTLLAWSLAGIIGQTGPAAAASAQR